MDILSLLLLPGVALAVEIFTHEHQTTTDITTLSMPANVTEAYFSRNHFGVAGIPASYFQNFPFLLKIWLPQNQLDDLDIPDFCFAGVGSSLDMLYLAGNLLTVIRKNQFNGLHQLHRLYLRDNRIHSVEAGKNNSTLLRSTDPDKGSVRAFSCRYILGLQSNKHIFIQGIDLYYIQCTNKIPTQCKVQKIFESKSNL